MTETDGALSLRFAETTDGVATVSYAVDGEPERALALGVDRVPLSYAPRSYRIIIRLIDGRRVVQCLERGNDGRYELAFSRC